MSYQEEAEFDCFIDQRRVEEEIDWQISQTNEFQNAFAWNRMNRKPDDTHLINQAIAQGKFVVVTEGTEYCPSTDAIMGTRKCLSATLDTREEAVKWLEENDFKEHDDLSMYILPRPPVIVEPYVSCDDDIPF